MRELLAFAGLALVVIVVPGPDMALVLRNGLGYGRRAAVETALGINAGLLVWALAAALGIAALLHASAYAFTALKLAGAAYLVLLGCGLSSTRGAGPRRSPLPATSPDACVPLSGRVCSRTSSIRRSPSSSRR